MTSPAEKLAAKKAKSHRPPKRDYKRKRLWSCRVRELRKGMGLSLRDVAHSIGLSGTALYDIELGTDPQLTTARKLADFFGKSVEELWPERAKE